ncbi:MAG: phenylalanine--tRNA ligase subunit alpha, partial [Pseudothermotoga sp.]|nr:phenylalanine--tRNA ligase subunit alpha [Pseudothermotoga sp.]
MFEEMKENVLKQINDAQDVAELEKIRINYLGKKGILTEQMRSIGKLRPEERPKVGQVLNELKETIERALEERKRVLEVREQEKSLQKLWIDVTLPGAIRKVGHPHPISKVLEEIETIFVSMGFKVVEGPEKVD